MRTVDPDQWSRSVKKSPINVARPFRFRINEVTALEVRLRRSFCDAMRDFYRNFSVEGVGTVNDKKNLPLIRWCYLILLVSLLISGMIMISWNVLSIWNRPPLSVPLQSSQHPVQEVDFPAVAICSYNIISKSGLNDYAKYSLEKNSTYSMENLKRNLMAFGGLISRSWPMTSFDANFTKYLADVARETNVTNIIYKLSPKCESMLVRCRWRAQHRRCDHLFATRTTDFGYCCVFNGRFSAQDRYNAPHRVNTVGEEFGLTVVINDDISDYTYVRRLTDGFEMMLFDGRQYPLMRAGVIQAYPVQRGASVFVALSAQVQEASNSLRYSTVASRGCHLASHNGIELASWSHCVAECRRRATVALCMCSPHTKPSPRGSHHQRTCSLEHIACLDKHKEKMSYFYPGENVHESLRVEQANSVDCLHCRPNCARLRYATRTTAVPHHYDLRKIWVDRAVRFRNSSVIWLYFTVPEQRLYLLETNLRVYELISFISCQWVFLMGITIISVMELIYHCTFRWCYHYKRRWRPEVILKTKNAE